MTPPSTNHTKGEGIARIEDIIVSEDRQRKATPAMIAQVQASIVPSIAEIGLINPITLLPLPDGKFLLLAGWSRLTAFKQLGFTEIPYNTREHLTEAQMQQLELEENVARNALPFIDHVLAIAKIYRTHKKERPDWGMRECGLLVGTSASYVSEFVNLERLILAGDQEIIACSSVTEVRKVLAQRKLNQTLEALRQRTLQHSATAKAVSNSNAATAGGVLPSMPGPIVAASDIPPEQITIPLTEMFHMRDCFDWMAEQPNGSIDLVYTDIPYGIPMEDMLDDRAGIDRVADEHDVEENLSQMPRFLKESYRLLPDKGYCIFWMDMVHFEKLLAWGEEAGFTVQRWPITICKTSPCKNRANHCWWTKNVEWLMVMRKGTATIHPPQLTSYFSCSFAEARKDSLHPFIKPFDASKFVLTPILTPGMKVLDPYAGSGALSRHVIALGGRAVACEKKPDNYNELINTMKSWFQSMNRGKINFT